MALSEFGALRQRVHREFPSMRLFKDEQREGRFVLVDIASGAIEADGMTALEVRRLCSGEVGLAQVRQEPHQ